MNRRFFLKNSAALIALSPILAGCRKRCYTASDFAQAPKADAHFHYHTTDDAYLTYAHSIGMHLVSVNVDAGDSIDEQLDTVLSLRKKHPDKLDFLGTFSVDDFGKSDFAEQTIARIERCMNLGALGVKIWKNIGMTLQDERGEYVMPDHPAFAPVYEYLDKQHIPLMAHIGEPKNCWLPYEEMSMKGDLQYYLRHPQYHMYQHPEKPSYEAHVAALDRLLKKYPGLQFVGAHIGSLEWDLDEVAKRFDAFPNFSVDLSARMSYLQLHSHDDRAKTKSFLTKYRDRILYGSDAVITETKADRREARKNELLEAWREHWNFIATDEIVPSNHFTLESAPVEMEGLQLPRDVVDKIFFGNFARVFGSFV